MTVDEGSPLPPPGAHASSVPPAGPGSRGSRFAFLAQPAAYSDVVAAAGLAVVAAILALTTPAGSGLRAIVALPILLVVPGYLLIEATVGSIKPGQRGLHALVALGVSPPLVALLALSTAALPGGFHAGPIVAAVTIACLGLAVLAARRRARLAPAAAGTPNPA